MRFDRLDTTYVERSSEARAWVNQSLRSIGSTVPKSVPLSPTGPHHPTVQSMATIAKASRAALRTRLSAPMGRREWLPKQAQGTRRPSASPHDQQPAERAHDRRGRHERGHGVGRSPEISIAPRAISKPGQGRRWPQAGTPSTAACGRPGAVGPLGPAGHQDDDTEDGTGDPADHAGGRAVSRGRGVAAHLTVEEDHRVGPRVRHGPSLDAADDEPVIAGVVDLLDGTVDPGPPRRAGSGSRWPAPGASRRRRATAPASSAKRQHRSTWSSASTLTQNAAVGGRSPASCRR